MDYRSGDRVVVDTNFIIHQKNCEHADSFGNNHAEVTSGIGPVAGDHICTKSITSVFRDDSRCIHLVTIKSFLPTDRRKHPRKPPANSTIFK